MTRPFYHTDKSTKDVEKTKKKGQIMIAEHPDYNHHRKTWSFMRDAWAGQSHIRCVAEHKGYYSRRTNFTDTMATRYLRSGRYPNVVNTMVNQGVHRALCREPKNMDRLAKYVENPEKFLSWFLKQLSLVGGAGIALDLNGTTPSIVPYNIETIRNWSDHSIAMVDKINIKDEFGFNSKEIEQDVVIWKNNQGQVVHTKIHMDPTSGFEDREDHILNWNGRNITFLPFCRVCTEDKPVFFGLAETSLDYFLLTALRNYILQQMVPQPMIILPDENTAGEQQLQKFLEDKTIEYAAGTMLVLPHGSQFKIESPVVRPLAEMRQELVLIKDEMISQGVDTYMQRGGQIGNMNADTVRLHMNQQMLSFYDVLSQAEWAINKLLSQIEFLQEGDMEILKNGLPEEQKFQFNRIDFSNQDIEDVIDNVIKIAENPPETELGQELMDDVIEELRERKILPG